MTPFVVRDKLSNHTEAVACGKCPACVKRRTSAWVFRLQQEEKQSISSQFITLTYGTNNLQFTDRGLLSLSKADLQLFFKRLRKAHEPGGSKPIKYYAVGEYGGKTERPHYHIILFNSDITKIQTAWDLGAVHYGEVSGASIGYTLKYISKQKRYPRFDGDDRQPEFSLMSKGLGAEYINSKTKAWHCSNLQNRMYCVVEDGKKISMPRYYKEKIYEKQQRKAIGSQARQQFEEKQTSDAAAGRTISPEARTAATKAAFDRMAADAIKLDKL